MVIFEAERLGVVIGSGVPSSRAVKRNVRAALPLF